MDTVDGNTKQLLFDLKSFDKTVRRNAVVKLGLLGTDEAVRALILVVGDKNEDLIARGKAALMLGKLRDQRAVDALLFALTADGLQTPMYAAEALGKIGDKRAISGLLKALQSQVDGVHEAALKSLNQLGFFCAEAVEKNALTETV